MISNKYYEPTYNPRARLISPEFPVISSGYCLRWYFHVWGVIDRGELSIRVLSKNGEELQLWRFVESVGNFWNAAQATIQLPNSYNNFQIVLQGNDHACNYHKPDWPKLFTNLVVKELRLLFKFIIL